MAVVCTNNGLCFPVPLAGGALAQEKHVTLCDWLAERTTPNWRGWSDSEDGKTGKGRIFFSRWRSQH